MTETKFSRELLPALDETQIKQLLKPIHPSRVMQAQGHSHVSQQDVIAHLIRVFGFGNFDIHVLNVELVFEEQATDKNGVIQAGRVNVCYKALISLTVKSTDGTVLASYENGSMGIAQNQSRGDGHDLAYKSAISLSVKRAAINLGDQFGLSLYNKGQREALVMGSLAYKFGEVKEDVQEGVKQQESLGNDEADRENTADGDHPSTSIVGLPAELEAIFMNAKTYDEVVAVGDRIRAKQSTMEPELFKALGHRLNKRLEEVKKPAEAVATTLPTEEEDQPSF